MLTDRQVHLASIKRFLSGLPITIKYYFGDFAFTMDGEKYWDELLSDIKNAGLRLLIEGKHYHYMYLIIA